MLRHPNRFRGAVGDLGRVERPLPCKISRIRWEGQKDWGGVRRGTAKELCTLGMGQMRALAEPLQGIRRDKGDQSWIHKDEFHKPFDRVLSFK